MTIVTDSVKWTRDDGGAWLCFRADQAPSLAAELTGKRLTLSVKEFKAKRSADANALYRSVLAQLAAALGISNNHLHNIMLRRYGAGPERVGDYMAYIYLPDDDATEKAVNEAETYHLQPTSGVSIGKDGIPRRAYIMLRGSSSFDTKEFSRLLDGLLSECREVGLSVLWGDKYG